MQGYGNNNRHSTRQFDAPRKPHRRRSMTTIWNAENKYKRLNTKKRRYENKEKSIICKFVITMDNRRNDRVQ